MIIFIFSIFFCFCFPFLTVSKSFKLMTARWNVCRTNRMWRAIGLHTYKYTREKRKKHLRKLVMFTCHRLSLPLAQRPHFISITLHTDKRMNYWICVRAISSDNEETSQHKKKLTCICFSIFTSFSLISFLRVFVLLSFICFIHREMGDVFVLYFPSIECSKQERKVREDQNLHACTHAHRRGKKK